MMKTKMRQLWITLRSSFWFLPTLMLTGAGMLAAVMLEIDGSFAQPLTERYPRILEATPEGARSILSGIASSMINIAGVTFSITVVALSLASGQYTSRALRNFMRDRVNQVVLGVFVSVFVYCLIVLRNIRQEEGAYVPSLSLLVGIALGITGIVFLVFFIHHVATSIQASTIISNIGKETLTVLDDLYPEEYEGTEEDPEECQKWIAAHQWTPIPGRETGYIQAVDQEGLITWADKKGCVLRSIVRIGEFVIEGKPILGIFGKAAEPGDVRLLNRYFSVAPFRTIEQDPAFGIRQLVDISLKALSPGVNDTTTAVTCLHYMGAILERISSRKIPSDLCRRGDEVRLVARGYSYRVFVDQALHQIRQEAKGNVAVHLALLDAIEAAIRPCMSHEMRKALNSHLDHLKNVIEEHIHDSGDREVLTTRLTRLLDLHRVPPPEHST